MNIGKEIWMLSSDGEHFWSGGSSEETFMFNTRQEAEECKNFNIGQNKVYLVRAVVDLVELMVDSEDV